MTDADEVRAVARPLSNAADLEDLVERAGSARVVLIGQASHRSEEREPWRRVLTQGLMASHGFELLAIEEDESVGQAADAWLRGRPGTAPGETEADGPWPRWAWAGDGLGSTLGWLRQLDEGANRHRSVIGLDQHELWRSLDELLRWVQDHRPDQVDAAREACCGFEPFGQALRHRSQDHGFSPGPADQAAVEMLMERWHQRRREPPAAEREAAARFYRSLVRGGDGCWNLREQAMADRLDQALGSLGPGSRAVVWAHNLHVADARATELGAGGYKSLGQLARERHGDEGVCLVGVVSHRGPIRAAPAWGQAPEMVELPEPREGSVEALLHETLGDADAVLVFPPSYEQPRWLRTSLDHRVVGTVYRSEEERWANYVYSTLGDCYDALIWTDDSGVERPPAAPGP